MNFINASNNSKVEMVILKPQERLRALANYSSSVEVDPSVPPKRYYRSGLEMVRMANVYNEEGSYENAYILYMKFMTLFLEKIRKHPDYASVSATDKSRNQSQLREVLPKAEKLKAYLLAEFTKDYNRYIAEDKQREKEKQERQRKELEEQERLQRAAISNELSDLRGQLVEPSPNLDNICYPDPNTPSTQFEPKRIQDATSDTSLNIPSFDRGTKPSSSTSSTSLVKPGLRTVVTPAKVMSHFLTLSQQNTFNNVETCGILAGKLEKHHLVITHVILPKQKGTPDSCTTMNEEEIFDYQDTHNLITIGWIHTHPTQTAFLSSVDLHTHCPYQLLMPEAIAIVCAPKYEETGFFILTPNYGLQYIANCKQSGFHPHPTDPPLFMNAEHVKVDGNAPLEVLDLR